MSESLHELAERYLAENPQVAEAMRLFHMSREEYEKALAAMQPRWTESTADHAYSPTYQNNDRLGVNATEGTYSLNI